MSLVPSRDSALVVRGTFSFTAKPKNDKEITDAYELEFCIPATFPHAIPEVKEIGGKISRDGKHHVNPDHTLCLGSPLRILSKISKQPTLVGFSESCLVPYLYAVSRKLQHGETFVFSELAHGEQGIIDDYMELFGLKTRDQVIQTLTLLGKKRRIANKKPCPCGCGRRLGKCSFNKKINKYRRLASMSWFRTHAFNIGRRM